MARYIDADNLISELSAACMPIYEKGITGILGDNSSIMLTKKKKNKKNYKGENAMSETVSGEELEKINGYAREPLTEDKVFVFRVALCDNDIDRDGEKFSSGALEKLAELFKGRTGIFDHDPKSSKQTARIFDTWVETLPGKITTDERSTAGLWQRLTWCELLLTATL